jgi:hypothetical protein
LENQTSNYPEQDPRDTLYCIINYLEEICGPYCLLEHDTIFPLVRTIRRLKSKKLVTQNFKWFVMNVNQIKGLLNTWKKFLSSKIS